MGMDTRENVVGVPNATLKTTTIVPVSRTSLSFRCS
jgi:hypothetical protein